MVIDFFFPPINRLFIVFSPRSALDSSPHTYVGDSIICFIAFGLIIIKS